MMGKTQRLGAASNNKIWHILFGVVGLVIFAQLVVTNILAVKGEVVSELEGKASVLSRENQSLREEMSAKGSITHISKKAQELGLVKASNVVWVDLSNPVASLSLK